MRAHSGIWLVMAGLAAIIALDSLLPAAEPKTKDDPADDAAPAAGDDGSPKKKDRAVGAKDPVAAAFALPKGVELNPAQQAAYDDLKQRYEPVLRQAFDDVQKADDAAATSRALKEARETRAKIRAGIQEILAMPYRAAAEKASQPSAPSAPEGSSSGSYVPQYGGYGGYYPGGYYPGGYYPGGYYPYRRYDRYSSSRGTNNRSSGKAGSSSSTTTARPASTAPSTSKPNPPKPSPPKPSPKR